MMKTLRHTFILLALAALCGTAAARERVFLHTDKELYVAGERLWMRFYAVDDDLHPSTLSRVGYVELLGDRRSEVQYKLSLDEGAGWGSVRLPMGLPTGSYEVVAYTRTMRGEGPECFFRRTIGVVNTLRSSSLDRLERVETLPAAPVPSDGTVRAVPDRAHYAPRERVRMRIEGLPADVADLTVSVVRDDLLAAGHSVDLEAWSRSVRASAPARAEAWTPECEGHIIEATLTAGQNANRPDGGAPLSALFALVGSDLRLVIAPIDATGKATFYTGGLYGTADALIVAMEPDAISGNGATYKMDVVSPFAEGKADTLPPLRLRGDIEALRQRSLGVQVMPLAEPAWEQPAPQVASYYRLRPTYTYDLDDFNRFPTLAQTIIEYVRLVGVRKIHGQRRIVMHRESDAQVNNGNTLVVIDGIPVLNHETVLDFDPELLQRIAVYANTYLFGGKLYEGLLALETYKANLPAIQLDESSQLIVYPAPNLPQAFPSPRYESPAERNSLRPDFRHTLYWSGDTQALLHEGGCTFYTSDEEGVYRITVEGFTRDGAPVSGGGRLVVALPKP